MLDLQRWLGNGGVCRAVSSVEAGENEKGAAAVAFACTARLTASLPSSALTEGDSTTALHPCTAYFSASGIHTQRALPRVPPPCLRLK
jgi:hypothetical protein